MLFRFLNLNKAACHLKFSLTSKIFGVDHLTIDSDREMSDSVSLQLVGFVALLIDSGYTDMVIGPSGGT
jgi:hypothetical protein